MKLLLENWREYLNEEKRKNLADDYFIQPDFGNNHTDKVEVPLCGDSGDITIGGTNTSVGTVYLVSKKTNQELMQFTIHKYNGWLGDLTTARESCSSSYYKDNECGLCLDDLNGNGLNGNGTITDKFSNKDLYSGHWEVFEEEGEVSQIQLAKLGIALREAVLFLLKEKVGAEYYVYADATHQGGSNKAAQKVVKILVKRGALGKEIDLSPIYGDEEKVNKYLVFPISNPKNAFEVRD